MSVCGPPSLLSVPPKPTFTTGKCLEWQIPPSARMEALMQYYQAAGFSKEVSRLAPAPRRSSTNKMHDKGFIASLYWATRQRIDLLGPTAAQIAAFLYYLFGLWTMDLERPKMTRVLPQCDLGIVREALTKPSYEPLREASLKYLTLKTVFLLAMASAADAVSPSV